MITGEAQNTKEVLHLPIITDPVQRRCLKKKILKKTLNFCTSPLKRNVEAGDAEEERIQRDLDRIHRGLDQIHREFEREIEREEVERLRVLQKRDQYVLRQAVQARLSILREGQLQQRRLRLQ